MRAKARAIPEMSMGWPGSFSKLGSLVNRASVEETGADLRQGLKLHLTSRDIAHNLLHETRVKLC